jgi:acyl carrier protein
MPIDRDKLRAIVVSAVATAAEMHPDEIDDTRNLFDLGLDSLSFASILIDIEDGVGEEVPAEVLDRFLDIGDVVTIGDVVGILATWEPGAAPLPGVADRIVVREPVPGGGWYEESFAPGERL